MNGSCASKNEPYDFGTRAAVYDQHRRPGGPFYDHLIDLARRCHAADVLELGPGTGNSTQSFLAEYECNLVGLDRSLGMLGQARRKGLRACWLQGNAEELPLQDESIDMIFSVLVSHHIGDLNACMEECRRVLRPKGIVAMATTPRAFIENHPLNEYFPSFAKIDLQRFPDEKKFAAIMDEAGLESLPLQYVERPSEPIDAAYAEKISSKFISTLDLLPEDEFNEGNRLIEEEIKKRGRLKNEIAWQAVVVSAQKSSSL